MRVSLVLLTLLLAHANAATPDAAAVNEAASSYSFNPLAVRRDPFLAPEAKANSLLRELNRFEVAEMQLVAIMTGLGPAQAMIVLPNNSTHIVQIGDSIGPRDGRISRITANEIVVRETFKDFQGRRKTSVTNLVLAP